MPDISMCNGYGNTCPLKETCYRYMAIPNSFRQSYASFEYTEKIMEDGKVEIKCNDQIKLE